MASHPERRPSKRAGAKDLEILRRPASATRHGGPAASFGGCGGTPQDDYSGFTLIELIMSVVLFAILAVTTVYLFRAILLVWSSQEKRAGININLDRGIEEISRDLRKAREVQSTAGYDEIRFRQGTTTSTYYIFYLYNASDSYVPPPAFNQASYQLKRATLSGGINGTFTYGAGEVIVNDVVPPTTSDLSLSGNLLTVDLTVSRADETIRTRTQIRPRNV